MQVNAHCHLNKLKKAEEARLFSVSVSDISKFNFRPNDISGNHDFFTIGIHPWDLNPETYTDDLKTVEHFISHPRCVGVGEFGFDRVRGQSIDLQKKCFQDHIDLLKRYNSKLAVLHIVKGYDLLSATLSAREPDYNILIHDYNGNTQITEELIRYKKIFFSLGKILGRKSEKFEQIVNLLPMDRIFFETDDRSIEIDSIYEMFMERSKITDKQYLSAQIEKNYRSLLGLPIR